MGLQATAEAKMAEAERRAWHELSQLKLVGFGCWASHWMNLSRWSGSNLPNPFSELAEYARDEGERR